MENKDIRRRRFSWLLMAILAALAVFSGGFWMDDFGVVWDEPTYVFYSSRYARWLTTIPDSLRSPTRDEILLEDQVRDVHPEGWKIFHGLFEFIHGGSGDVRAGRAGTTAFVLVGILCLYGLLIRFGFSQALAFWFSLIWLLEPHQFAFSHLGTLEGATVACLMAGTYFLDGVLFPKEAGDEGNPSKILMGYLLGGVFAGLAISFRETTLPLIGVWCIFLLFSPRLPLALRGSGTALFLLAAGSLFLSLNPLVWDDPLTHVLILIQQWVDRRQILPVLPENFLGVHYPLGNPPWYYGWVYLLATLPTPWVLLGVLILMKTRRAGPAQWKLRTILGRRGVFHFFSFLVLPLIFSLPDTPKWDGVRLLFPSIFFGWLAILCGLKKYFESRLAFIAGANCLYLTLTLLLFHPCQLSYYNLWAGSLRGASSIGLLPTYWWDGTHERDIIQLAREFKSDQLTILGALPGLMTHYARRLAGQGIQMPDWKLDEPETADFVYTQNRPGVLQAYGFREEDWEWIRGRTLQGVWIAGLWKKKDRAPQTQSQKNN